MKQNNLFASIFGWMFLGLLITFGTGYYIATNPNMILNIFGSNMYWLFIIAEIGVVIYLSSRIMKMQYSTAAIWYAFYSWLSGVTFATIFVVYELESIMIIFLMSAALFGIFAFFGYVTKIDLTKMGSYLLMALIGIIIVTIVSLFINISGLDLILSYALVLIFVGLTAYDVQKIKLLSQQISDNRAAIIGALTLYLDFINLFINLLRIFGARRD